uniref:Proline dehydrogenase n=1 Tax=Biomphalaria glabrata TaxID=6526 RepID=A0A2C9JVW9_BIOGL
MMLNAIRAASSNASGKDIINCAEHLHKSYQWAHGLRVVNYYLSFPYIQRIPQTHTDTLYTTSRYQISLDVNKGFKARIFHLSDKRNFSSSHFCLQSENGRCSHVPAMFENNEVAYSSKSTWELCRALVIFFLCKFTYFTDNAVQIMSLSYTVLGRRLSDFIIGRTIYNQFVAGKTIEELKDATKRLGQEGIGPMLCTPIETDANSVQSEGFFDTNVEKILDSLHLATQLNYPQPTFQFRLSALMSGNVLKLVSKICGQTTHNDDVIRALLDGMKETSVDFTKLPGWEKLLPDNSIELNLALQRLGKISKEIQKFHVMALIDAEYTYINPALRMLSLALMKECNRSSAKVLYTYQAYLKRTHSILKSDLEFAKKSEFCFGLKLVRGAYMVRERMLAKAHNYEDPVHESFDKTSASYNACLDLLFDKIKDRSSKPLRLVIASHNEDTICYALNSMKKLGIDRSSVYFGQLYGMADHVSCTLAHNGYHVYKSIPYGTIADTLPYLARRAQENTSMLANARRERQLVAKAIQSRLF